MARIQPSLKNPHEALFNNFVSTLNILEYAKRNNIKVVYAGSSSVHHGLCRFYNVYGPHQVEDGVYSTLMGIFQKQYREGKSLTIVGTGKQRRDFTHIDDIVSGLVKSAEEYFKECEIFELGSGVNYSINEIADMFGKDYPKEYIEQRPGEYDVTLADYSHARDLLGWNPTRTLQKYVEDFVETEKFFNE